jgi:hypothetical protein
MPLFLLLSIAVPCGLLEQLLAGIKPTDEQFAVMAEAARWKCAEGGSFEVVRAVVRNPATLDLIHIQNDANRRGLLNHGLAL